MPNESGDFKLLANFRKLIDLVSADSDYNLQMSAQADSARCAACGGRGRGA